MTPAAGEIELNAGLETRTLTVANTGDRPIQVGSHYHFFEVNPALDFPRDAARGMRLDVPAGSAVRFEPGQSRTVTLVPFGGARRVFGFAAGRDGPARRRRALVAVRISRAAYADMFGPTTGDRVRLADTELVIEVEADRTTLRRRGEVRRRQGDPRRHGPEPGDARRRAPSTSSSRTR